MRESCILTGIVIYSAPVGENDRRIVVLSREVGRTTVFAGGCRKPTSPLAAFTRPFTVARFTVYPGKDSYYLQAAEMLESFDGIAADFDALTYGTYFLELAGYFSEENVEATQEVDLLFLTIKALQKKKMPCKLIRAVYELKLLTIQGIAPDVFECRKCHKKLTGGYFDAAKHGMLCRDCREDGRSLDYLDETSVYCMQFVETVELQKLYSFNLREKSLIDFCNAIKHYYNMHIGKQFKSLEMIFD